MRKLFFAAIISGFALRLGIPGFADLITISWELLHPGLIEYFAAGFPVFVTLAGIGLMVIVLFLNYGIFLKGLKKGRKGIFIVLLGVALGLLIGSLFIGELSSALGSTLQAGNP